MLQIEHPAFRAASTWLNWAAAISKNSCDWWLSRYLPWTLIDGENRPWKMKKKAGAVLDLELDRKFPDDGPRSWSSKIQIQTANDLLGWISYLDDPLSLVSFHLRILHIDRNSRPQRVVPRVQLTESWVPHCFYLVGSWTPEKSNWSQQSHKHSRQIAHCQLLYASCWIDIPRTMFQL